jgi:competence protein ComEC
VNSDGAKDTDIWRSLVFELDDRQRQGGLGFDVSLVEGDEPFRAERVSARVVAPRRRLAAIGPGGVAESGRPIRTNTISAVVKIEVGDEPVALIASDLDDLGLDELLETGQDLRAPVLMYPHHGGRSGSTSERDFATKLMAAVEPETVLFSIARGIHRNPLPEVTQAVRSSGARVRIACTELSRNCADAPPTEEPHHLLPLRARGRATRSCCGGTFRIDLEGAERILEPSQADHSLFIAEAAPTALCTR